MHSKKDSKKLKAILLAIDLILLAAAIGLGGICFLIQKSIDQIPEIHHEQQMQEFDRKQAEMEEQIQSISLMLENKDLSADADIQAAKQTLEEGQKVIQEAALQRDTLQAELDEICKFCNFSIQPMVLDEAGNLSEEIVKPAPAPKRRFR